jgi:coenzyme F420-reducing hydrogenase alpha subunit
MTPFDNVDAEIRSIGAQLMAIGGALLKHPECVTVGGPDGSELPCKKRLPF